MGKLYNLARMTVSGTPGTGTITLNAAVVQYLTFAQAGVQDGDRVSYAIYDPSGGGSEDGEGVYTASGTTLTRGVTKSTNSNNLISVSSSAEVFISPRAEDLIVNPTITPQGRLTLTSGSPVLTATTSGATTVYYSPYVGNMIPLYDGNNFVVYKFTELQQATTDTTKSPAAVTTNSNYDLFVWSDSGTLRCTRGPAWTSSTGRGTGAGTTELTRVNGIWLNANAITNGPGASRGTYVGTIRSNGSSQIDWIYGAVAAGGTAGFFGVWNCYNRVDVACRVGDNTNSWAGASGATWRAANNSSTMRVSFVRGLDEDAVTADYLVLCSSASGTNGCVSVGLDTTTGFSGLVSFSNSGTNLNLLGTYAGTPGLGFHYLSANELVDGGSTVNFFGDIGLSYYQSGLNFFGRM